MDTLPNFEIYERHACYRPVGPVALKEAVALVSQAIKFCGDKKIERLVVNVTGLSGFGPLNTFERFSLAEKFALVSKPGMKIVLVTRPEMIDPDKFGVMVARNRGLDSNVFSDEQAAIAWLLAT